MRRLHIFLFILAITLSVLLTLTLVSWYFAATAPSYYGSSWMGQMWGSHIGAEQNNWGMGGFMGGDASSTLTPSYLWLIPTLLIGIASIAVIGIGFYLAYPELKYIRGSCNPGKLEPIGNIPNKTVSPETKASSASSVVSTATNNCDVLLKTMTPEEQKVFNVLINHQGKYLQKYVAKEAELSRLKTHRIVARFAQRGIVSVNEFGNTNEILISDWVKTSKNQG